tara:strand:- start:43 stop:408 length:366 start_codon:yes stop_codon:yes gene_type:complete
MKKIVIDLDNTITLGDNIDYKIVSPNLDVINMMKNYKNKGFTICIFTARNMRTYSGNLKKISENTLPIIVKWLKKYDVPYDEIIIGKPWCGDEGFYVDDKAIRPNEFLNLTYKQIIELVDK